MRRTLSLIVEVYGNTTMAHVLWTNYGFVLPILDRFYIRNCLVYREDLLRLASQQKYHRDIAACEGS